MPEKTDYSPVTEHAPEAEAKRERRTWTAFLWGVHAFWIYAVVLPALIVQVVWLLGGIGQGRMDRDPKPATPTHTDGTTVELVVEL